MKFWNILLAAALGALVALLVYDMVIKGLLKIDPVAAFESIEE